ncbi:hypothetical protein Tco_0985158, partial [Tanacetum coccineum]
MCAMLITAKAASYSPRSALQTKSPVFERLFLTVHCKDEFWGLDHPRYVSVPGVGWRVGVTILSLLIEAKPPCFFTEAETEYLTKRIQDGIPDVVKDQHSVTQLGVSRKGIRICFCFRVVTNAFRTEIRMKEETHAE